MSLLLNLRGAIRCYVLDICCLAALVDRNAHALRLALLEAQQALITYRSALRNGVPLAIDKGLNSEALYALTATNILL